MARRGAAALAVVAVLAVPASAEAKYAARTLDTGSKGRDVTLFQRYLTRAGFDTSDDGRYGSATRRSMRRFERAAGRRVDGRATPSDQKLVRQEASGGGSDATGGAKAQPAP